jgi:hypothetical protein
VVVALAGVAWWSRSPRIWWPCCRPPLVEPRSPLVETALAARRGARERGVGRGAGRTAAELDAGDLGQRHGARETRCCIHTATHLDVGAQSVV